MELPNLQTAWQSIYSIYKCCFPKNIFTSSHILYIVYLDRGYSTVNSVLTVFKVAAGNHEWFRSSLVDSPGLDITGIIPYNE
jgi:hypothetical protein